MIQYNVDRNSSIEQTKAPFTYDSTLSYGDTVLSVNDFVSIKITVTSSHVPPVHIARLTQNKELIFSDSRGTDVGYVQLYDTTETDSLVSSVILSPTHIVAGHIVCSKNTINQLLGLLSRTSETVYFGSSAFVLLPQCHVAMLTGTCRSIRLGDVYTTANAAVHFKGSVYGKAPSSSNRYTLTINTVNSWDNLALPRNNICVLTVGSTNYWVGGCHLLFKHGVLSNLRVIHADNSIMLKGVTDV